MFERLRGERDVSRALLHFRRLWWVVVVVAILAGSGAYLLGRGQPKQYSASAALLFRNARLDQALFGIQVFSPSTDPTRDPATNESLLNLPTIAMRVAQQLHMSQSRVQAEISVGFDALSDVVTVTATATNPTVAAELANAYVDQYIAFRRFADRSQLSQAEYLLNSELAAIPASQQKGLIARGLQTRRNQVQLLAALQTGNAEVVEAAIPPTSPVAPRPTRDALIGLLLGLLVGSALVAIIGRYDGRFRSPQEIEGAYEDVPIIGTVPESSALRQGAALGTPHDQDAFRMIRAQLRYFDVDRDTKSVLITSADQGEGKSLLAAGLAQAAGQTHDNQVLLLEADLRSPSLAEVLGLERVAGLAELLSDSEDVKSALSELVVTVEQANGPGPMSRFDVLLAGTTPPNPGELLDSKRMANLMDVLGSMYDVVLIDTPPIGVISDAVPLVHRADGVLVVSRLGQGHFDHAIRVMKQLRSLNAHVLGVVINYGQPGPSHYSNYDRYRARDGASNGDGLGKANTGYSATEDLLEAELVPVSTEKERRVGQTKADFESEQDGDDERPSRRESNRSSSQAGKSRTSKRAEPEGEDAAEDEDEEPTPRRSRHARTTSKSGPSRQQPEDEDEDEADEDEDEGCGGGDGEVNVSSRSEEPSDERLSRRDLLSEQVRRHSRK